MTSGTLPQTGHKTLLAQKNDTDLILISYQERRVSVKPKVMTLSYKSRRHFNDSKILAKCMYLTV